jgi:hypothetical protein
MCGVLGIDPITDSRPDIKSMNKTCLHSYGMSDTMFSSKKQRDDEYLEF